MRGVNPTEIPVSGERYDLTCIKAGVDKRGEPLIIALIDTGPYKGKRVSGHLEGIQVGQRFSAVVTATWFNRETNLRVDPDNLSEYDIESGIMVLYELEDAREPEHVTSYMPVDMKAKFRRK